MKQQALDLHMRRAPRELSPLERLQRVLRRRGIEPDWRWKLPSRDWILPTPCLDVGDRLRTLPRPERWGIPATGAWETLCAWHVNAAQRCPEDRYGYSERVWVKRAGVTRFVLSDEAGAAS
ncbi:MAG: hypothetical protein RI988_3811 [Pseudomonadota bacterium]